MGQSVGQFFDEHADKIKVLISVCYPGGSAGDGIRTRKAFATGFLVRRVFRFRHSCVSDAEGGI